MLLRGAGLALPGPVAGLLADPRLVGPAGIAPEDAAAITAALTTVATAEAEAEARGAAARPTGRFSLAVMAARALYGAGQPLAAALLASAARGNPGGDKVLLWTLAALRRDDLMRELLDELAARADLHADLRPLVQFHQQRLHPGGAPSPVAAPGANAGPNVGPNVGRTEGLPLPGPVAGLLADPRLAGPAGIAPEDAASIAAALAGVVARAPGAGRFGLAVTAALDLTNAGQPLAAALLASAARGNPGGDKLLLLALVALGRDDLLPELLAELASRDDLPKDMQAMVFAQRVRCGVGLGAADQRRFWGPPGSDLAATLAAISDFPGARPPGAPLAQRLIAMRATAGIIESAADFTRRMSWGHGAETYLRFLRMARRAPHLWRNADAETRALQALCAQIDALHQDETAAALALAQASGRSIVVTRAHAGVSCYFGRQFGQTGLPVIGIAAHAQDDKSTPERIQFATRGDFKLNFIKLVKMIRKTPSFVSIFPDGGHGGDLVSFDLLGAQIRLGQGAATLAWHGRAETFFYRTAWDDGRLVTRLIPGPSAADQTDRAAFDAAFYGFYVDQLRQIVLGPPEDMVAIGGFWPMLIDPPAR